MEIDISTIQARFVSDTGEEAGPPLDLPIDVDVQQLELICNALLKNVSKIAKFQKIQWDIEIIKLFFRRNKHHICSL